MRVNKVIMEYDDLILIDGVHDHDNMWPEIKMCFRRIELLDIIREATDPAELPEYLSDEDLRVVEVAKLKLDELTGSKNGH